MFKLDILTKEKTFSPKALMKWKQIFRICGQILINM